MKQTFCLQLVMEYCLGSASDLLEGELGGFCLVLGLFVKWPDETLRLFSQFTPPPSNVSSSSSQETTARSGDRRHYSRRSARVGLLTLP